MNKRVLLGTVLTLAALMILAAPVSASVPTEVSGTYSLYGATLLYLQWQPAGNNCQLDAGFAYPFEGDLEGSAVFHYSIMVHGACTADVPPLQGVYDANLKAWGTFTGEVLDEAGEFDFTYEGKEWPYGDPGDLALSARIVILSGTGDLQNLHGVLDVTYTVGDAFDIYSGWIHFDP